MHVVPDIQVARSGTRLSAYIYIHTYIYIYTHTCMHTGVVSVIMASWLKGVNVCMAVATEYRPKLMCSCDSWTKLLKCSYIQIIWVPAGLLDLASTYFDPHFLLGSGV